MVSVLEMRRHTAQLLHLTRRQDEMHLKMDAYFPTITCPVNTPLPVRTLENFHQLSDELMNAEKYEKFVSIVVNYRILTYIFLL